MYKPNFLEWITMSREDKAKPTKERRLYPRVDTLNMINFLLFDTKGKKIGHGKGKTINLSQSGALLLTKDKLEGAFIVLIAIDLDKKEIKVNGKIITSRVCKETDSYLTGIAFIGSKKDQLSAIVHFVKDFHRKKHNHTKDTEIKDVMLVG
jgi:hypothetical protein